MDKELKGKLAQARQVLETLEKLAEGADLSGVPKQKCENCHDEHPTMEDAIKHLSGMFEGEKKAEYPSKEKAKEIKRYVDEVLYRKGGFALIAPEDNEGSMAYFGRKTGMVSILAALFTALKETIDKSKKIMSSTEVDDVKKSCREALEKVLA